MALKQVIVVISLIAISVAYGDLSKVNIQNNFKFMKFMARTELANSQVAQYCFTHYAPLFEAIVNEYETSYNLCINESEVAIKNLNETTLEGRNAMDLLVQDACGNLADCKYTEDPVGVFDCYSTKVG